MRSRLPWILAVIGMLAGALLSTPAHAAGPRKPDHPGRSLLAHPVAGKAAVAALGDQLDDAAAVNEMSSSRLKHLLESDRTTTLARDGRMFFADQVTEPDLAATAAAQTASAAALYPADQTFTLHSLPGSNHTIYLDFDGYTLPPTNGWATDAGVPATTYGGSSPDLAYIQSIWRIVAEKFAPFDVDVTTQEPLPGALTRTDSTDPSYGTRIVFTDDQRARPSTCSPNGCVGIAWLNVFNTSGWADDYRTIWVFTTLQFTGRGPSRVSSATAASAAAHEVGHNFGLHHADTATLPYFDGLGHGNWFPLMGSSYNAVGQWSKGEYAGATNLEDDTAIIASRGAPLRADEPTKALGAFSSYAVDGVISTATDVDTYSVERTCSGPLTASVTGIGVGQAVDLRLDLLDPDGAPLLGSDPASSQTGAYTQVPTGMDAAVSVPDLGAGNFSFQVSGVGRGSALLDGYSRYGSLGGYRLTITGCADKPAPPAVPAWTVITSVVSPPLTAAPGSPAVPIVPPTVALSAPSAPGIGRATSGRRGGARNAAARWTAPASTGGTPVIGYRVRALRLGATGRVLRTTTSSMVGANVRALTMRLPAGRYRFTVVAINKAGTSPASRASAIVTSR